MTIQYQNFPYAGTAWDVFRLFKDEPNAVLLESSLTKADLGRYSFIAFRPFQIFSGDEPGSLEKLRAQFRSFAQMLEPTSGLALTPFISGIVGFLSYDFGLSFEKIVAPEDELKVPGCFFGFYDSVITVDHLAKQIVVTATGLPEKTPAARQQKAATQIKKIGSKLGTLAKNLSKNVSTDFKNRETLFLKSNFTKPQYLSAVRKALGYIEAGDIYQVNLAQRFSTLGLQKQKLPAALEVYSRLRRQFPSCFGAFFNGGNFEIASHSPERFLHVNNGVVETRPMKGTRRRGSNAAEDEGQKKELLNSPKEQAELLMVTDLERNDLGRVCRFGSVEVSSVRTLEEYKGVFQTTSSVRGILPTDKDDFDLLAACSPGGSVTGCPKIRAMQIISELEPNARSIYTGSLGYMDFGGNMDFNILIRSVLFAADQVSFHVGGGIVADSDPEAEYEETLLKAEAMMQSLGAEVV